MNIEEFYDADERRRESQEVEFGNEWVDTVGHRFDLSYIVDTAELYLMSSPDADVVEEPFGELILHEGVGELTVEVLATVPTLDEVHQALSGWEQAMGTPNSLGWLRERVRDYAP